MIEQRMAIGGIDVGLTGGLAVLNWNGACETRMMPVMGKDKASIVDGGTMVRWLAERDVGICIVERAGPMPAQGLGSTFKFGTVYGQVLGALQAAMIPYKLVTPTRWKRHFGLDREKEASRRVAIERFPYAAHEFSLVKSHGRAEAALIALWWYEQMKKESK
jgi:crossover junction endodeoxyribonuclease RuvC